MIDSFFLQGGGISCDQISSDDMVDIVFINPLWCFVSFTLFLGLSEGPIWRLKEIWTAS